MAPAIRIDNLSKRYFVDHEARARTGSYRTLRESLSDLAAAPLRRLRGERRATREEFWALKDVSVDVQPGEVLGIIGPNGAGKSTLLKILSRITKPTAGRVELNGRVGSLLEVGTGFHPELTGRENIYLNGSILGMRKRDIDSSFDAIVAFADIEQFLDTPVKRYSSGMYVRLAFAVAAHLEPEILIIDEVLAVGDAEFQAKCIGKMQDISGIGRTVIFVSHNMPLLQRLCTSAVLLAHGQVQSVGPSAQIIDTYLASQVAEALIFGRPFDLRKLRRWGGTGEARATAVTMFDPHSTAAGSAFRGGDLGFRLKIDGDAACVRAAGLNITDESDCKLININTFQHCPRLELTTGAEIEFVISQVNLRPGRYKVGFWLGAGETRHIDVLADGCLLEVLPPESRTWMSRYEGLFRCSFQYRVLEENAA